MEKNTPIHLTPPVVGLAFVYALFVVVYTQYLAYNPIGGVISVLLVLAALSLAMYKYHMGLLLAIVLLFTTPMFPRDLLDIYEQFQDQQLVEYYSIKYLQVAGFTLTQWLLFGLFFIGLLRSLYRHPVLDIKATKNVRYQIFLIIVLVVATAISIALGRFFDIKEFVSDMRVPLLIISGLVAGVVYLEMIGDNSLALNKLVFVLMFVAVVSGFKVVLFLVADALEGEFRLTFENSVWILFPAFVSFLIVANKTPNIFARYLTIFLCLLGLIPDSRGAIILYFVSLAVGGYLIFKRGNEVLTYRYVKTVLMILVISSGMVLFLSFANERFFDFILFKLEFFTDELWSGEISHSPAVRIYEFLNILNQNFESVYGIFVGFGAGGYFTFDSIPFPYEFGVSDFSVREQEMNMFFHPHLPLNFFLLKGGGFGLALYAFFFWQLFKNGREIVRSSGVGSEHRMFIGVFAAVSAPIGFVQSFWLPEYVFLYGFLSTLMCYIVSGVNARTGSVSNNIGEPVFVSRGGHA